MNRRAILLVLTGVIGTLLGAPAIARPAPATVFAAASLTDALRAVGKTYTARTGTPVRFVFAASNLLAKQIESGAKADVFVSADRQWMDHVERAGFLVAGSRHDLLRGRLVLIAPADSRTNLRIGPNFPLAQALGPNGRLAVGDPDYVPAGLYAKAALTRLGVVARRASQTRPRRQCPRRAVLCRAA